jgi:hypothetical protein
MTAEIIPFHAEMAERASDEPALVVDVEGFEGPLDLLLSLARQQKVDLAKISILALSDQYLAFIEHARKLRRGLPISSRASCCPKRSRKRARAPRIWRPRLPSG